MLEIYKIPVHTPYPVGPVNAYLVKNQPYTLVDPGPETAEAKQSLAEGLASLGVDIKDISRVVLTHSHTDHSGLARWLSEIAGAQIYVHRFEVRKLTLDYDFYQERLSFFQEAGMPTEALKEILNDNDAVGKPVLPDTGVTILSGGETLKFEGGALLTLHMPGHSDGHICLYDQDGMCLLAGDFILKHISPNPNMEPDPGNFTKRLPTLKQYLGGLDLLENLKPRLILPGHGKNIENGLESVKKAREHHKERLNLMTSVLENNSHSVYQLMRFYYPQISGFEIYLGISEVFAHVDYLLAEGRIIKKNSYGISLFQRQAGCENS
ncbi:MBL fold metallo-hydrolase [Pelotomaculum isophthalicicum JI]|uniref:MBL fold metallo-hydrolase n=1 Tax=Pelotomaculum isophthalicicum JI TaxID=947010 RepID=A0A9X4JT34_9FIRM|nr:MBL fold metallo-hydrolase [Pelotomaculum isophthalicicum]MDF9408064.1 MBL fold metallo-hydrolase [Pelotomaculum isophthalicicum JI]